MPVEIAIEIIGSEGPLSPGVAYRKESGLVVAHFGRMRRGRQRTSLPPDRTKLGKKIFPPAVAAKLPRQNK